MGPLKRGLRHWPLTSSMAARWPTTTAGRSSLLMDAAHGGLPLLQVAVGGRRLAHVGGSGVGWHLGVSDG